MEIKLGRGQTQLTGSTKVMTAGECLSLERKIANGLHQLRKSKRLTQEELARKLNSKQAVISRIEKGASIPSLGFVKRIAKVLDAEVAITFQPAKAGAMSSALQPSSDRIEYICVDCLYRWRSKTERSVMQCPQCHKRQGVMFSEYSKALGAYQDIQLQVKKSPPFKKLPPLRSLRNTPDLLRLIFETASSTFPSPRLPISLFLRIVQQSSQEQIKGQSTCSKPS